MAALSRAQLLKELLPGLNALFGLEYKRYPDQHLAIFDVENSERSFEEEVKLAGFDQAVVKPEGEGITYQTGQEAWTARYTHETVAMGFSITEEAMEDNLYDSLSARYTKAMARSMSYTKQTKAAAILNNGFSASYTYGDGKRLFATDHPLVSGGTNSNRPTNMVDISETALEDAVIQIAAWVDERGLLISAKPTKLIIPPALQFEVKRILESDLRVGSADNDINAVKGLVDYTINNYLTDTDAWFLKTDVPNALKMFTRVGMSTKMDGDFDTGNVRYKARERYSFGVSDPLGIYGSSGA